MSPSTKFNSAFAAMLVSAVFLACVCGSSAFAQTTGPNTGAGAGTAPAPKGQDYDPAEHSVVSGVLKMKKEGDKKVEGEDDNVVGYISSALEVFKVTSSSDKILSELKERDGKKISVEGRIDLKTSTIAVSKILEGVLPPSEMRNPRGL